MQLLNFEKSSLDEVRRWQWLEIKKLLYRAEKTKFYNRIFRHLKITAGKIKNFEEFAELPETTEDDLRNNPYDFLVYRREKIWRIFTTTGTTGKPKIIFREPITGSGREILSVWHHLFNRINYWPKLVGIFRPGRGLAASGPVIEKIIELLEIPCFSLSIEAGVEAAENAILALHPDTLISSPSFAVSVLKELKKKKIPTKDLGFKIVVTTGEALFPEQRQALETAFKAELVNVYGAADPSVWLGSECHKHTGLHIFPYTSYIEKVADGLLVTPFANKAMALVRYKLKDDVAFDYSKCACGRTLPRITSVSRLRR